MPLYSTPQSGPNSNTALNITSLSSGDPEYTLLNGTETLAQGAASISFSRGYSAGVSDNGITFNATAMPSGCVIDIQVAPADVATQYTTIAQITGDANGNAALTDTGRSPFWRLYVSSSTAATGAIVKATR